MSTVERMPTLPGDVQAVLDVERDLPALGDDVQQRLRRRLEVSVGILALGVGTAAVTTTTTAASAGTAAIVTKAGLFTKPWIVAALAFVLGGVTGAGLYASVRRPVSAPPQVTTVFVDRRIEVPAAAPTVDPIVPSKAEPAAVVASVGAPTGVAGSVTAVAQAGAPTGVGAGKPGDVASTKDTGLAAERALLEVARTALSRGDTASAMASLDDHAKRFPSGQLAEEREALYVQALARAGRLDEAKARAARFSKRFPGSMLLPVVEAATE